MLSGLQLLRILRSKRPGVTGSFYTFQPSEMTFRQAWVTSSLGRDALWSKILRKVMFIEWTRNWPIRRRCSNFGICFFQPHSLLGKTWAFVFLEEFFSWKSLHRKIVLSSFQRRKYFQYDVTMPWVFEFFYILHLTENQNYCMKSTARKLF